MATVFAGGDGSVIVQIPTGIQHLIPAEPTLITTSGPEFVGAYRTTNATVTTNSGEFQGSLMAPDAPGTPLVLQTDKAIVQINEPLIITSSSKTDYKLGSNNSGVFEYEYPNLSVEYFNRIDLSTNKLYLMARLRHSSQQLVQFTITDLNLVLTTTPHRRSRGRFPLGVSMAAAPSTKATASGPQLKTYSLKTNILIDTKFQSATLVVATFPLTVRLCSTTLIRPSEYRQTLGGYLLTIESSLPQLSSQLWLNSKLIGIDELEFMSGVATAVLITALKPMDIAIIATATELRAYLMSKDVELWINQDDLDRQGQFTEDLISLDTVNYQGSIWHRYGPVVHTSTNKTNNNSIPTKPIQIPSNPGQMSPMVSLSDSLSNLPLSQSVERPSSVESTPDHSDTDTAYALNYGSFIWSLHSSD